MLKRFKYQLWNWVFSYLTKPVSLDHILTYNSQTGQVYLDKRLLTPAEIKSFQEQIKGFNTMAIRTIMLNTLKADAERQIYNAKSMDEMIVGKAVLYTVDLQETILMKILNAPDQNQVLVQPNPYRK